MKNIKTILTVLIVFSIQLINAQEQDLIRAKRYFDRTYYSEALPFYENAAKNDRSFEVVKNLADCYYYTNDLKNAERWYGLLVNNFGQKTDADYYFKYAQSLKVSGKYDAADKAMRNYLSKTNDPNAVKNYESDLKTLENVTAIGKRFDIKSLPINTKNSEFGAVRNGENLIFSGIKSKPSVFDKTYKWNNESYLDLKSSPVNKLKLADSIASPAFVNINTVMHESDAVFTKDGKTMYFTRNNFKNGKRGKDDKKISHLQIFKSELKDKIWQNATSLPFNSDKFSNEHPALSPDEKTLYFASDMPGSIGSFDIYSVSIDNGNYGTPKNLGNKINTVRKEQFPFVSNDNKLYFSSNGLLGYGSLDVFVSDIKNGDFMTPINVGLPVNSGSDDFAFNIDANGEGYFSSNRAGGKGGDDIYSLKETKPLIVEDCKQYINVKITDAETKLPIEGATVVLQNDEKKNIDTIVTSADGAFVFIVPCHVNYNISASKPAYTSNQKYISSTKERNKIYDASMTLQSEEAIKKQADLVAENEKKALIEKEKQDKIDKKNKEIQDKKDKIAADKARKEQAVKDKKDKIAADKELKEQEKQDRIAAQKEKKQRKPQPVAEDKITNNPDKKSVVDKIVKEEKNVIKDTDNKLVIKTEPIYFDYRKWDIREDAKPVLDKVINLMKKYTNMEVEIGSHTDNRASEAFNLDLSDKRAAATRDYFITNGIPESRIFAKGYGESEPAINCRRRCTESNHDLNRRSEFVIKNL